jgi:putative ABC transport system permease protein
VAVALIGVVSAAAFLRHSEHHRTGFALLGRVPWELASVALAVYSWNRLSSGGAFVEDPSLGIERPSLLLLAFPLVAISGVGGLLSRGFDLVVRRLRGREARSQAVYLAIRRLGGGSRLPALLVAASILSLGLAANAAIVAGSIETTVDAKARAFVGSDAFGRVLPDQLPPEGFPLPATRVRRRADAGALVGTDQRFDLLVIDASSFSRVAYWNDAFAGDPLETIVAGLEGSSRDGLPIAISGGGDVAPTEIEIAGRTVDIRIVARARAFPGMVSLQPMVIADEEALREAFEDFDPVGGMRASAELWVRGDPEQAAAALQSLPFPVFPVITAEQVQDIPEFTAVIGTFAVMDAVALAAALLVMIVMLMYLQARQRSQLVAFGLSMRMGMTHATHRRSLVLELATMLLVSLLLGVVLGTIAAWMVVPLLDPIDTIPPSPLFVVPFAPILAGAITLATLSWLGGLYTERRARRVDLGEVMRVAE